MHAAALKTALQPLAGLRALANIAIMVRLRPPLRLNQPSRMVLHVWRTTAPAFQGAAQRCQHPAVIGHTTLACMQRTSQGQQAAHIICGPLLCCNDGADVTTNLPPTLNPKAPNTRCFTMCGCAGTSASGRSTRRWRHTPSCCRPSCTGDHLGLITM